MLPPRRYAPLDGSFAPVRVAGFSGLRNGDYGYQISAFQRYNSI